MFELSQNKRLDQSIEFADAVHNGLVDIAGTCPPRGVRQAGFWGAVGNFDAIGACGAGFHL